MAPVESIRPATPKEVSSAKFLNRRRGKRESPSRDHARSALEILSTDPVVIIDFGEPEYGTTCYEMTAFAATLRRTARDQGLEVQTAMINNPEKHKAFLAARILPDSS